MFFLESAMKFMLMFRPEKEPPAGKHACRADLPEMQKLIGELMASGVLVATHGLMGAASGARVKRIAGKMTVRDGPFAETKELIAGVCLVEVKSKDEAVALAQKFLEIAGDAEGDVLQVIEQH
jgi:hypothetical protein